MGDFYEQLNSYLRHDCGRMRERRCIKTVPIVSMKIVSFLKNL